MSVTRTISLFVYVVVEMVYKCLWVCVCCVGGRLYLYIDIWRSETKLKIQVLIFQILFTLVIFLSLSLFLPSFLSFIFLSFFFFLSFSSFLLSFVSFFFLSSFLLSLSLFPFWTVFQQPEACQLDSAGLPVGHRHTAVSITPGLVLQVYAILLSIFCVCCGLNPCPFMLMQQVFCLLHYDCYILFHFCSVGGQAHWSLWVPCTGYCSCEENLIDSLIVVLIFGISSVFIKSLVLNRGKNFETVFFNNESGDIANQDKTKICVLDF